MSKRKTPTWDDLPAMEQARIRLEIEERRLRMDLAAQVPEPERFGVKILRIGDNYDVQLLASTDIFQAMALLEAAMMQVKFDLFPVLKAARHEEASTDGPDDDHHDA